jgi:hypothetical protein
MLLTPSVKGNIEGTHSLRDGRTVRVGNIDQDAREPSILQVFCMSQMGAVPASDSFRVLPCDRHVVDVIAPPLRIVRRQHWSL